MRPWDRSRLRRRPRHSSRSGLDCRKPCRMHATARNPAHPPSCIDPGVSGAAWNAAGEAELLEQAAHALLGLRHVRVDLAIRAFEPCIGDEAGSPMARSGDVDHVEVACLDSPAEMNVNE